MTYTPKYSPEKIDTVIVGCGHQELIQAINLNYKDEQDVTRDELNKTLIIERYLEKKENDANRFLYLDQNEVTKWIESLPEDKVEEAKAAIQDPDKNFNKLCKIDDFIDLLFDGCNDYQAVEDFKQDFVTSESKLELSDFILFLKKTAQSHGVDIDPLLNVSNVEYDIRKKYSNPNLKIHNAIKVSKHKPDEVNAVIVGAGPAGLLETIALLNADPNKKVVLIEKYDEYKRSHTLWVNYKQVKNLIKALEDTTGHSDAALDELYRRVKADGHIRISEIEQLLKNRAVALGAQIVTRDGKGVADVQKEVIDQYPNISLLIGADGTRSVVSQQLLGPKYGFAQMRMKTKLKENVIYVRPVLQQLAYSVITPSGEIVKDIPIPGLNSKSDWVNNPDVKKQILEAATKNFHAGNTVKKEFDYVMQLRVEVEGDEVTPIPLPSLVRIMQNYGITCDEYVGKKDEQGRTPITFQLMISKKHFKQLEQHAKSANPIKPFPNEQNELDPKVEHLPPELLEQVKGYLGVRLRHFTKKNEIVDLHNATLSVNEAPATYAKNVYKDLKNKSGKDLVVKVSGDAAIGLSYFKGINAAFESLSKALPSMVKDVKECSKDLKGYQAWFSNTFAPQKVQEVRNYSKFRIQSLVLFFKTMLFILRSDFLMRSGAAERTVDLYLNHLRNVREFQKKNVRESSRPKLKKSEGIAEYKEHLNSYFNASTFIKPSYFYDDQEENTSKMPQWDTFAHDGSALDSVLTIRSRDVLDVPMQIIDEISAGIEPYRAWYYFFKDIMIPARAVYQLTYGLLQLIFALPLELSKFVIGAIFPEKNKPLIYDVGISVTTYLAHLLEGTSRVALGLMLAVETLFMPFRIATRTLSTLVFEPKTLLIESKPEIRALLVQASRAKLSLDKLENEENKYHILKNLSSMAVSVHKTFQDAKAVGEYTNIIDEELDYETYIQKGDVVSLTKYFGLFTEQKKKPKTTELEPERTPTI